MSSINIPFEIEKEELLDLIQVPIIDSFGRWVEDKDAEQFFDKLIDRIVKELDMEKLREQVYNHICTYMLREEINYISADVVRQLTLQLGDKLVATILENCKENKSATII